MVLEGTQKRLHKHNGIIHNMMMVAGLYLPWLIIDTLVNGFI
jgi:hypothetical protein